MEYLKNLWNQFVNWFYGVEDLEDEEVVNDIKEEEKPKEPEKKKETIKVDRKIYENMTKNDLVQMLVKRGIKDFNKRQLKRELIDLLVKDDKEKLNK